MVRFERSAFWIDGTGALYPARPNALRIWPACRPSTFPQPAAPPSVVKPMPLVFAARMSMSGQVPESNVSRGNERRMRALVSNAAATAWMRRGPLAPSRSATASGATTETFAKCVRRWKLSSRSSKLAS